MVDAPVVRRMKSANERMAQYIRARGRMIQALLRDLSSLEHRGSSLTWLGRGLLWECRAWSDRSSDGYPTYNQNWVPQAPDRAEPQNQAPSSEERADAPKACSVVDGRLP